MQVIRHWAVDVLLLLNSVTTFLKPGLVGLMFFASHQDSTVQVCEAVRAGPSTRPTRRTQPSRTAEYRKYCLGRRTVLGRPRNNIKHLVEFLQLLATLNLLRVMCFQTKFIPILSCNYEIVFSVFTKASRATWKGEWCHNNCFLFIFCLWIVASAIDMLSMFL